MALNAQRFIVPLGDLSHDMFPGEDLPTRLDHYLAEATAKVGDLPDADDEDAFIVAYVHWRAYSAKHVAMLAAPSTVALADQGSHSLLWSQIEAMGKLAEKYKLIVDDLFVPATEVITPSVPASGAVPNRYAW